MRINFYTGPQCCLCDDAKALLLQVSVYNSLEVQYFNVREDKKLYHLYGARIPVLQRIDNNVELGWPFDLQSLERFLN